MYLKCVQEQDCERRNQGCVEMMHSLFNTRSAVPVRVGSQVCVLDLGEASPGTPWLL